MTFYHDYNNPLVALTREIREAVERKNYYISLLSVLSLIDICASLEAVDGKSNKYKFAKWFNENMPSYSNAISPDNNARTSLSGEECYEFRSRLLHQGRARILKKGQMDPAKSGRIAFSIDGATLIRCNFEGTYFVDIVDFTQKVCEAVTNWHHKQTGNDVFKANYGQMLQYVTEVPGSPGRKGHFLC